jgi:tRNA nucleotidyltransferase/poly(A) polymerase
MRFSMWLENRESKLVRISDTVWDCPPMDIPSGINRLYQAFTKAGFQIFIVGGSVRDHLLGLPPKDFDLATNATPDQVKRILDDNKFERTDQVGQQFGVVITNIDNEPYEIATFRTDLTPGRQTEVRWANQAEDAQRRDLTMNALFYDIGKHHIIDFVGGVEDTVAGKVRPVGDPMERFAEDPLRVLRLIRFYTRFNKTPDNIDADVKQAVGHFVTNGLTDKLGGKVAPERIRDEFKKGLKSAKVPVVFLQLYDEFGLLRRYVIPGFSRYNTRFINSRDFCAVIAAILKYNKIDADFETKLKSAIHENSDVERILYYLKMLDLKHGNKVRHMAAREPEQGGNPDILTSLMGKEQDLSDEELQQWARWFHMPIGLAQKFRNYQMRKKLSEIPGGTDLPPGPMMGKYVKGYNTWAALRHLGMMPDFKEWLHSN